jgi:hypothetical protein
VASAVAPVWLAEVQRHPFLIFGGAASFLKLMPVWQRIYLPFVALMSWGMMRAAINLVRPQWARFRVISDIVVQAAGWVLVYIVLRAGPWVALADGVGTPPANLNRVVYFINQSLFYSFLAACAVSAMTLVSKVVRLARSPLNS